MALVIPLVCHDRMLNGTTCAIEVAALRQNTSNNDFKRPARQCEQLCIALAEIAQLKSQRKQALAPPRQAAFRVLTSSLWYCRNLMAQSLTLVATELVDNSS